MREKGPGKNFKDILDKLGDITILFLKKSDIWHMAHLFDFSCSM